MRDLVKVKPGRKVTTISSLNQARGMKTPSREEQMKPYVQVAEGMESQFAGMLIQQMRKSIPREQAPSSAQEFYESMMDQEHADAMAKSDTGLGIKRMLLDQIVPSHLKDKSATREARAAYGVPVKGVDE
jgi:Rod binding domain-containing protein